MFSEAHFLLKVADRAFLGNTSILWTRGEVPWRIETDDYMGKKREPVFTDAQIANITSVTQHIQKEVPCIVFR